MLSYFVMNKIQELVDKASVDSRTSYDEYIRLFSIAFDKEFKRYYPLHEVQRYARTYGYVTKSERNKQGKH
ncbi:hypothetical protein [Aliivibrio fischeri]|uniref:hypothetical protein n=1 Tax=Aliivibrio fischeri TaxID=668 RepID=UPI00080E58B8|nr:hypothetical protein [Aliivibrio fischeri]OCH42332.1 hypothetical protein A6E02_14195 [Aliivibrio fischeri]